MAVYAYKITRDYGFAPNPFGAYCSLACCKPHIRKKAKIGDWIIGTGAVENGLLNHLIFLMKVTDKLTFQEYWLDERFNYKKPVLNGSLKQIHGDNIYSNKDGVWIQSDSHHSLHDGLLNEKNLKQDLSGEYVLVSDHFVYLGDKYFKVPNEYLDICPGIRHRDYITVHNEQLAREFIDKVISKYDLGLTGLPLNWKEYGQKRIF
ncbi:hypothetical protein H9N25_05365 [Pedobacter riviphilus]|uniref:Nucleotide modification associated domain-containing protein n=1 Tax=Pedobacter riviphilus TaxID=2766984 RepID=A0ABX6TK52_9SPHI|nr:hypothetical protein [Pedobacter riviphilus]QNR85879.1 hypothetical protein H9N25_05365 [Pedobacter riviphilus]